jgi:hypothetical protein
VNKTIKRFDGFKIGKVAPDGIYKSQGAEGSRGRADGSGGLVKLVTPVEYFDDNPDENYVTRRDSKRERETIIESYRKASALDQLAFFKFHPWLAKELDKRERMKKEDNKRQGNIRS